MEISVVETIVRDGFWLVIIAGWIFLILTGLEADKPLSGGLPGHVSAADDHLHKSSGLLEQLGEKGDWIVFGAVCAALPVVLWWIFAVHGRYSFCPPIEKPLPCGKGFSVLSGST